MTTMASMAAASFLMAFGGTPPASDGLQKLATTGYADEYAKEIGGMSYDKTGGSPAMFTYDIDTPWQTAAMAMLNQGEFLAPHFAKAQNGIVVVMVAPHLLKDGEVVKMAGPDDNFIIVYPGGQAYRYDYSKDVSKKDMMMDKHMKHMKSDKMMNKRKKHMKHMMMEYKDMMMMKHKDMMMDPMMESKMMEMMEPMMEDMMMEMMMSDDMMMKDMK